MLSADAFALLGSIAILSCGASTPPHQATMTADAPKIVADAGAPTAIADAGVVSAPNAETDAGDEVAIADAHDTDASPPKATHSPVHIPGRCIDAQVDVKRRSKLPTGAELYVAPDKVDLDGDGVDDSIFETGANGIDLTGNVHITRGKCAIMVLSWKGGLPYPATTSTHGFLDLEDESPCKPHCCTTRTVITYKWDGQTYVRQKPIYRHYECGSAPASND